MVIGYLFEITFFHISAVLPDLIETFHDQVMRTNGFLSLRCTASGNPPPRIYWYLDGSLILPQGDYVFGSYMHVDGNSHISRMNEKNIFIILFFVVFQAMLLVT